MRFPCGSVDFFSICFFSLQIVVKESLVCGEHVAKYCVFVSLGFSGFCPMVCTLVSKDDSSHNIGQCAFPSVSEQRPLPTSHRHPNSWFFRCVHC